MFLLLLPKKTCDDDDRGPTPSDAGAGDDDDDQHHVPGGGGRTAPAWLAPATLNAASATGNEIAGAANIEKRKDAAKNKVVI